jgi:hypothetical protein
VFETIAALSTLCFIAVFVTLFHMDRSSRKNEHNDDARS